MKMNNFKIIALLFLVYTMLVICIGSKNANASGKIYTPSEPKYGKKINIIDNNKFTEGINY